MQKYIWPALLILSLFFQHCTPAQTDDTAETGPVVDSTDLEIYISTLGSDEFEGRMPFTAGEQKTLDYLTAEFKAMGLEPGNGDSYLQPVPLVDINGTPDPELLIEGPDTSLRLQYKEDFMINTRREGARVEIEDSELVFCGYGIVAPEYGWNDYKDIDMTGKTAVVLVNDPGFESEDSTLFKGKTMTYYGRWTYKIEEAARQGAEGLLIIHQTVPAGYPWFVVRTSWAGSQQHLPSKEGDFHSAMTGWISLSATASLLRAAPIKETRLFELAKSPDFKPIPLGLTVSGAIENKVKKDVSQNVIAKITGSKHPDEYIIYVAHWDHLGVGAPVKGDSIYNGAMDNATGTGSLMAIAKAFAQMEEKPERSVVFLAVTAEEQGLLGSAYYAQNPIYPVEKTVALINMDGANVHGPMKDFTITGYGQSEMDDYARAEAEKQGRYVQPEQEPEKGFFFRSDQFSFAKVGVPALYGKGGYDHLTKGKKYAMAKKEEYTSTNYHQPSDEYDEKSWSMAGVTQDAQLFADVGLRLANSQDWPRWKEGSEFKAIREKKLED